MKPDKKLIKKWYKKLADTGFKDIESTDSPREMLKVWHSFDFRRRYTPEQMAMRERYYQLCRDMLHTHRFASAKERKVWELHAEGLGAGPIAKQVGLGATTVKRILKELKKNISSRL